MIEQQVRAWDVLDERVLGCMRQVPRELFVPPAQRYLRLRRSEVPLAHGQHMLRPSVAGRLLQALLPQGAESVLEIGTGSGFITRLPGALTGRVRSLEIFPDLADEARRTCAALGMRDVEVIDADALQAESGGPLRRHSGDRLAAAYDARFERMLALGGRLFVVVGAAPAMEARLVRRTAETAWRPRACSRRSSIRC